MIEIKLNEIHRCETCGGHWDYEQYDECPYCEMPDDWAEQFDYNSGFDI